MVVVIERQRDWDGGDGGWVDCSLRCMFSVDVLLLIDWIEEEMNPILNLIESLRFLIDDR